MRLHRVLDVVLLLVVIGLPFYWLQKTAGLSIHDPLFFWKLRRQVVEASASGVHSFNIVNNLVFISLFLAMAMHYENDGSLRRRLRSYVSIAIALLAGVLTGSKEPLVVIIGTLGFISAMRNGKVNVVAAALLIVSALTLFGIGLLAVNFAPADIQAPHLAVQLVVESIQNYWLGGLVAFRQVVQDPHSVAAVQDLSRFFLETANGFGAHFTIPSINAAYTAIGPNQATNVYTMYFSYFPAYGWMGILLGPLILGGVLTWIFRKGLQGFPIAILIYGHLAMGILLSVFAEHFVLALNLYIKMGLFYGVTYGLLSRLTVKSLRGATWQHA